MRLERKAPLGVALAIVDGSSQILLLFRAIFRLQVEMGKGEISESPGGHGILILGKDEFEFCTGSNMERKTGFWAHCDPVKACRKRHGPVGFDRDLKSSTFELLKQGLIDLQAGLTAGEDNQGGATRRSLLPAMLNGISELSRRLEAPASRTIGAHEVGIAKHAGSLGAIGLSTAPEITPRESAKDSCSTCLSPLTLKGEKDLLDGVTQAAPWPA